MKKIVMKVGPLKRLGAGLPVPCDGTGCTTGCVWLCDWDMLGVKRKWL